MSCIRFIYIFLLACYCQAKSRFRGFFNCTYEFNASNEVRMVYNFDRVHDLISPRRLVSRAVGAIYTQKYTRIGATSSEVFRHPTLSAMEMQNGCKLGLDSWADTSCSGRHCHVMEFVEGKTVTAKGFANHLPSTPDLPIANVAYAYDAPTGEIFILVVNNSIYMGEKMEDSLLCPNQSEENGVRIDLRPKMYYPEEATAQTISVMTEPPHLFPLRHHGPLPYIPIRRPTEEEMQDCVHLELTSRDDWDPYSPSSAVSTMLRTMRHCKNPPTITQEVQTIGDICVISTELMGYGIGEVLEANQEMFNVTPADGEFDVYSMQSAIASRKSDTLTPEDLSRLWHIGIKTARRTLAATTHQCLRTTGLLTRRFRTDQAHNRYTRLSTRQGNFYVDTLFSKVKSIRGYTCGNVYTNSIGFRKFFPMDSKSQSPASLQSFIQLVGVPPSLHSDNAPEFLAGDFKKKCRKYDIRQTSTEPHSPWQNKAESLGVKEVKKYGCRLMEETQAPIRLWCFAYEYGADVLCLMATGMFQLGGRTAYEFIMHYTPDISEYVTFQWYQWAYYWNEQTKEKTLCRWLGVAHNVGQSLCYWILLENGQFIARSTVIPIPEEDLQSDGMKSRMKKFTDTVQDRIGDHRKAVVHGESVNDVDIYYDAFFDSKNEEEGITYPWETELNDVDVAIEEKDQDEIYMKDLDEYIGANIVLPGKDGASEVLAEVKGRKRDSNGVLIGVSNVNPILDTRIFQVEFPDGHLEEYATNIIIESLYSQVDTEGYDTGILDEIVGHRKRSTAISIADGFTVINNRSTPKITTKGWDVQVKWKDGSTDWLPLSQVKESNPIEVAEYAVAQKINREPAFHWWVTKVLKKRDRLIHKVVSRCRKGNMKFGIAVPRTVAEAHELDRINGNTFWADAIKKEMENVKIAFNVLDEDTRVPPGFTKITCHLIFDVKFDLTRKARYVAGGHLTDPPTSMTYASVVSRESVRIAFLIAALNNLEVVSGDIGNAYLNADTKEKVYFVAGPEWGARQGRRVVIVRALYGLKSSGAAWRDHLADTLRNKLKFKPSYADQDVWYRAETKADGTKFYSYILVYTDDILIVHTEPMRYMEMLKDNYRVKPESIGPPKIYLGANMSKVGTKSGVGECWGMNSEQYVREAVKNVKSRLKEDGLRFDKKLSDPNYSPRQPFSTIKYRPELDTTPFCTDAQTTYYMNLIGVLRWIVELGRIDIHYETAVLSQYLAQPRIGHLLQVIHTFKYLDIHSDNFLAFDPTELELEQPVDGTQSNASKAKVMRDLYPDAVEEIPPNAPEPRGQEVQINVFVDADHAGNVVTRRSHSGILIFLNMAPISWFSKKQNTVESSTFSSEFVALRIATELIISLRYKLRMFGVPINGPANVFCDNEAVYKNVSNPSSTLKKKHNSIAYHKVRESIAAGVLYVYKVESEWNLSDILTKALPPAQRIQIRSCIMVSGKVNAYHQ
jgi:hypothetical protein